MLAPLHRIQFAATLTVVLSSVCTVSSYRYYQQQQSGGGGEDGGGSGGYYVPAPKEGPVNFPEPKEINFYSEVGKVDVGEGGGKDGQRPVSVQLKNNKEHEDAGKATYKFEYTVHDPQTGDVKRQWEHRGEEGIVKGQYSLIEADGSLRTVHYLAHPKTGFHATVRKAGVNKHPPAKHPPVHNVPVHQVALGSDFHKQS